MIYLLDHNLCIYCKEEEKSQEDLCLTCQRKLKKINGRKLLGDYECFFPYLYLGDIKNILYQYKFRRKIYYKYFLANSLLEELERIKPDLLVPIPLAKRKLNFRGFQQVEEICKILSKKTEIPTKLVLEKTKHTKDQHLITLKEREDNLKGVFSLVEDIEDKKILLVDDITTTGITFLEAAKELEKGNPYSINFLAIAGTNPDDY